MNMLTEPYKIPWSFRQSDEGNQQNYVRDRAMETGALILGLIKLEKNLPVVQRCIHHSLYN